MTDQPGAIDVHGHGVPSSFMDWVASANPGGVGVSRSDGKYVVTFPGAKPLRPMTPRMLDFGARLEWLDAQHVEQQLIAPWLDVDGQALDVSSGQEWVRRLNDGMAEAVAGSNGRLHALATLHLAAPEKAAAELRRAGTELGMRGSMIPTHFPVGDLADRAYDVLFEAAASLRMPLVLHPPTIGPSMCMAGMEQFGGLYGRLFDTTMIAARLLVGGVFVRHPQLKLVLVHGGGALPYQTGRLERHGGRAVGDSGVTGSLTDYVGRFYYDTVLMSSYAVRLLIDLVGAGRVMIGSDYPFVTDDDPGVLEALDGSGVNAEAVRAVLKGNASELFRTRAG